ncbi:hypothetical protein LJR090_001796 [Bosea sp. LjRoot90]|uniref:hypothetical protein n=1 Tax=Bosea sp. LjRoot90 TaxID=3342342 RepID=UPI003ECC7725
MKTGKLQQLQDRRRSSTGEKHVEKEARDEAARTALSEGYRRLVNRVNDAGDREMEKALSAH